jgi:hypothetical protein
MHRSVFTWAAMALSGLSLLLVVVNAVLVVGNQSAQFEVNQRQQTINSGAQLLRLRQVLAQILGNLAVTQKDQEVTDLLARHGFTVNQPAAEAQPRSPAPPAPPASPALQPPARR